MEADSGGYFLELKDVSLDNAVASNWRAVPLSDLKLPNTEVEEYFQLYPNPATTRITIEWTKQLIDTMELFDFTGRKLEIRNNIGSPVVEMDVSHLPANLYLLHIVTEEGKSIIQKVSIMH